MISAQDLVTALKAAAEPTRLRILALLAVGELTVKDMTRILGQSQPRLSRHLKLLTEAGLVERAPEGSWVYFRLPMHAAAGVGRNVGDLARGLLGDLDPTDAALLRDRQRLQLVKQERAAAAQDYFEQHAGDWDRIRALHIAEDEVEAAMRAALGPQPVDLLVDVGTGTGRILELFATSYGRGLGFDLSTAMLAYAREKLMRAGVGHAQVRRGDIYDLPLADGCAGVVVMHQVLHFLADPARAVAEAARLLAPGGRLLIVDFAPHTLEFLREAHRHERLGFEPGHVAQWLRDAGLVVTETRLLAPEADNADGAMGQPGRAPSLTVSLWRADRDSAASLTPAASATHSSVPASSRGAVAPLLERTA